MALPSVVGDAFADLHEPTEGLRRLRSADAEAEIANRAKDELAIVSHELRTPLNAILG